MAVVTHRSAYSPRYRLPTATLRDRWGGGASGVQSKAVQAADDDAVTLGIRAAEGALGDGDVDAVFFATSTDLYEYGSVTPFLSEALGLSESVHAQTLSGSDRVGVGGLRAAQDAVDAGASSALVVAGSAPQPGPGTDREKTAGAGAGAVRVATEGDGLRHVASGSCTRSVLDSWQAPGEGTRHQADDRYARNVGYVETTAAAVRSALDDAGWDPTDVDSFVVDQPNPKFPARLAGELGFPDDALAATAFARNHGDLGAASVLAVLARADLDAGDRLVVAGYGTGMADALAYEVDEPPASADQSTHGDTTTLEYADYLEHANQLR